MKVLNIIDEVREIKSAHEISRIAWTSDVMTKVLAMMLGKVQPGVMVAHAIGDVTPYFYQRCLTESPQYNVMSSHAAGLIQPPAYTDDPHNFSCLTATCEPGGPFLGLVAGKINGYGAEIERTFFLQTIPEEAKRPFDTMMEMRYKAYDMLKPGAIGSKSMPPVRRSRIGPAMKRRCTGRVTASASRAMKRRSWHWVRIMSSSRA